MSGVAAVLSLDDGARAEPPILLDRLLLASAGRALRGDARWHDRHAALGLLLGHPFPNSSTAPVRRGPRTLVFDGRLDNRDDLIERLRLSDRAADDAEIAIAAVDAWGRDAAGRLLGDFAIVTWDSGARVLLAFRDPMGMRPLHWTRHVGALLVASDVAALLAVGGVPSADESAVADLLIGEPPRDTRTLYRNVQRLPGGCLLEVRDDREAVHRYWDVDPQPVRDGRGDAAWAEECRDRIDRAVRARMRSASAVAVYFSGGIDSSIVLTAAAAIARRNGQAPPRPLSVLFTNPASDESAFRAAVAGALHLDTEPVQPRPIDGAVFREQAARRRTLPDLPADMIFGSIRPAALAGGSTVALSGAGADTLFSGSILAYADMIAKWQFVRLARRMAVDRVTESTSWDAKAILTAGVWPLMPAGWRRRLRAPARRIAGVGANRRWLRLPHAEPPIVPAPPRGVSHATWEIACSLRSGWTAYFIETAERAAAEAGIEERFPFFDARVVSFALSLPEEQRRRDDRIKDILRRAVPELPQAVSQRITKADFGHLVAGALAALGGLEFFRTLAIAEAGWVDPADLLRRYDRITRTPLDDPRIGRDLPMLWMTAATELWYRAAYDTPARIQGAVE